MSAHDDALARIAELRAVVKAGTPGVLKLWGMTVLADQDGTSNLDTAVEVATTYQCNENGKPRTGDAERIAAAVNALPGFLTLAETMLRRHRPRNDGPEAACTCYGDVWPCAEAKAVLDALGVAR